MRGTPDVRPPFERGCVTEDDLIGICERAMRQVEGQAIADLPDLFDSYLDAACTAEFTGVALRDAPVALGWERWQHVLDTAVTDRFRAVVAGLLDGGVVLTAPIELVVPAAVAGLNELALAITGSPDPAQARRQSRQLVTELARSMTRRA